MRAVLATHKKSVPINETDLKIFSIKTRQVPKHICKV